MASNKEAVREVYQPKDAVAECIRATLIMGATGLTASAVVNTLTKQKVTAWGVFTRTGGLIGLFAAGGAAHGFGKAAAANLREKDDSWNPAIAGFMSGALLGLSFGTMPMTLGCGAALATIQGVFDYGGGKFSGYDKDPNVDEFERKEFLRKNRRKPIQEILGELGEGGGIYGPGYQERRAARIKDNYGIEVPRA